MTSESTELAVAGGIKTCFTCKHYRGRRAVDSYRNGSTSDCFKTRTLTEIDLVSGEQLAQYETAKQVRQDENKCGRSGVWWELYEEPKYELPPSKPAKVSLKGVGADDL